MALAFPTTTTTGRTASATTHVSNLASGSADELLVVAYMSADSNKYLLVPSGWDGEWHTNEGAGNGLIGFVYKETDGGEGSTETFTYDTTSNTASSVSFRVTGHDVADPFNTNNYVGEAEASEDPWTTASGLLTGINNSDSNIILVGTAQASRAITTKDSGLTLIDSNLSGDSVHVLRETSPGSSNSAYSNDMVSAWQWLTFLLEIKAASAGSGRIMGSLIGPGGMIGSNGGLIR